MWDNQQCFMNPDILSCVDSSEVVNTPDMVTLIHVGQLLGSVRN